MGGSPAEQRRKPKVKSNQEKRRREQTIGHREAKSPQGGGDEGFTGNFLISGRWETCDRSETVSGPTLKDVLEVFRAGHD